MKASAMTAGKFGHVLDADGFVVPEKFDAVFGGGEWVMDEKLDGHRCLITKDGDSVSTTLRSIPSLPAHIVAALQQMPDGVYDGELLVPGGVSTDVPNLSLRSELIFAMFDAVELAGQSIMHLPMTERRELLLVAAAFAPGTAVVVCAQSTPTWAEVKRIWANSGEGVILKKKSSLYRPGHRSADWLKVKRLEQHTVTVTGFEAGSLGPTAVTLFRFDDGATGRCKTLNNEELAQTSANPAAFVGRRLVVQCQQRMRGSNSPRHPMWDHWSGDAE
jgi:ATP-dependent DNA ligase